MNNIEQFFKDNLDNKTAYISSDGLLVAGAIGQKCKLEFVKHFGLSCSAKIEYNNLNASKVIEDLLIQHRETFDISHGQRDKIIDALIPHIKNTYIQVAIISSIDIEKISVSYNDKGNVTDVKIKYLKGSIITIRCIENISE